MSQDATLARVLDNRATESRFRLAAQVPLTKISANPSVPNATPAPYLGHDYR